MSAQPQGILVVSNPGDRDEIFAALASADLPEASWGDGGDDTYAVYEDKRPTVAVICANLDAGDARSLAAAMRSGPNGGVHIILIGEVDGPIRNALDAADFAVNRFLARPLSSKALQFCIREALAPVDNGAGKPAPLMRTPVLSRAIDSAIDDFVAEAIGSIEELVAVAAPMGEQTVPSIDDPAVVDAPDAGGDAAPAVGDSWEDRSPPPREPTLILSDGGASSALPPGAAPSTAVPQPVSIDITERDEYGPWDHAGAVGVDALDDEPVDEPLADIDDELSDLQEDIDIGTTPRVSPIPPRGDFARQLRAKMSQMAERLFPGHAADGNPVDVGVAHGHKTEIDLAAIDADGQAPSLEPEPAPYADLAGAETYSDDDGPDAPREAGGSDAGDTAARRIAADTTERGTIDVHTGDVAAIIARMFTSSFTGQVTFVSPPLEKSMYFDHGRPVFAASNLPHDRMGELLYREGKITRQQRARSRELLVESGRRMGEILVEEGFLKRRELLPAVRRHIEDIVYSLFSLREGEYVVKPGEFAAEERIRLSKHPAALILEGVRRKYGVAQLEARLGSASAIVSASDASRLKPVLAVADLSRTERAAIGAMDGDKTLEEVASLVGISLHATYQLAYGLVVLEVAEVLRRGDDADNAAHAVRPPTLVGETDLAIDRQRVLAKHSLVSEADYFALLGVRRDASSFEIKRAYESARRDYAEESFPLEVRDELGDAILEINELLEEAYRVLRDDNLRGSYLAHLRD